MWEDLFLVLEVAEAVLSTCGTEERQAQSQNFALGSAAFLRSLGFKPLGDFHYLLTRRISPWSQWRYRCVFPPSRP
jgi:hypothetical protein